MSEGRVLGIGCDLCAVSRMSRADGRFLARFYTQEEREEIAQRKDRAALSHMAACFAAKEAAAKALGTGFSQGVMPDQIGVVKDESGCPGLRLTGAALTRMQALGGREMLLTMTHEGDMAAAFAVLLS